MKWYVVSYDLNSPGQNYSRLHDKIKSIANGWCKILESVWVIGHNGNAKIIHDQLVTVMDQNDRLFVSAMTQDYYWTLSKDVADWFNQNVKF